MYNVILMYSNVNTKACTIGYYESYWNAWEGGLRAMCLGLYPNCRVIPFAGGHCKEDDTAFEAAMTYLMRG